MTFFVGETHFVGEMLAWLPALLIPVRMLSKEMVLGGMIVF